MDVLILGGTPSHRGGVELFCERARLACAEVGGHRTEHVFADTAYLRLRTAARMVRCVRRLARLRGRGWDCVWLQYVNLPDLLLLLACKALGYKVLVTPHLGSNWASQSDRRLRRMSRALLRAADGIALIAVTQADELDLPPPVPVLHIKTFLPRAFPPRPPPPPGSPARLELIHAGRLSAGKGSFKFIDVCALLRREGVDFRARMIGPCDEPTRERIRDAIRASDLEGRVEHLGPMAEPELLHALSQADSLVHLSEVDSFPLIVLEAIGCDVFPICRDLPGARFITRTYCGRLVAGAGAAADAAAFLAGSDVAELRAESARAGRRLAADYDWPSCVAALERAVSVVAGRVPAA